MVFDDTSNYADLYRIIWSQCPVIYVEVKVGAESHIFYLVYILEAVCPSWYSVIVRDVA